MTKHIQRSSSDNSNGSYSLNFREWLPRERFDELVEKSKQNNLNEDERILLIEELAYVGCPYDEIATLLNTSATMIQKSYKLIINRSEVRWRFDLRKAQVINGFENKGSGSMLIWLGKQYLSQKEDPQLEIKRDKFDEFIEWMRTQRPVSSESPIKLAAASSSIQ